MKQFRKIFDLENENSDGSEYININDNEFILDSKDALDNENIIYNAHIHQREKFLITDQKEDVFPAENIIPIVWGGNVTNNSWKMQMVQYLW